MGARTAVTRRCPACREVAEFSPYSSRCRGCMAIYRRARRSDADRANEQRWYQANAVAKLAKRRRIYWSDPEVHRARRRAYGQRPESKALNAQREAMRRAQIRQVAIFPFTAQQLAARLSMWPGCWMCGGPWTHVDHVKPLAQGGPHCLANFRPACGSCNSAKWRHWYGPKWAHALRARNGGR